VLRLTPDRRTLLALFSLAFGLRILYAVVLGTNPDVVPVRETYDFRVAARMAENLQWLNTAFSPSAPGYLILLSVAFRIAGASWWIGVMLNAALGAMTTLFLYRIGEKRLGRHVGLASALWLGATINHLHFASILISDVLAVFLVVWLAYVLVAPFRRMRAAVSLGILYVLLIYTQPMFLLLLPVLVIYLGLRATHHRVLSVQYLFLFLVTVLVFSVPWTIRNYIVHHEVIPIGLKADRYTASLTRFFREGPPVTRPSEAVDLSVGFLAREREFWRVARFFETPAGPSRGAEPAWSLRHNLASILNFGLLLPTFVAGVVIAFRRRHRAALILVGLVAWVALVRGFFGGGEDVRLPADPFIILVAFYGVRSLVDLRRAVGAPAS
jgi:4-amino-4-deoxy-L-arabinose transferase-like glycosyltransferase